MPPQPKATTPLAAGTRATRSATLTGHRDNEMADAAREADEMTSDSFTFGLFARALVAASKGNNELAKLSWGKLVALRTDWRDDPRGELERFIASPAILDRLIRDLRSTGLIENN